MFNYNLALGIVGELFHFVGSNARYTDKQLADFVHDKTNYGASVSQYLDPAYNPYNYPEAQRTAAGYSMYFHTIQSNICNATPLSTHGWR